MTRLYYSIYGPLIENFLELKRSLGYKYTYADWILTDFDRFAHECNISEEEISKDFIDDYCNQRPNESNKSRANRIQMARQFAMFIQKMGYSAYIPRLQRIKSDFTPYIFSKEQILTLFAICDQIIIKEHGAKNVYYIAPLLFRLLYGTGIRIGEALALCCKDVDLKGRFIVLHNCKNKKDRMVPISNSLADAFVDYLQYRTHWIEKTDMSTEYVFNRQDGKPCSFSQAYNLYRIVLFKAGIAHGGRGIGPRLHDIRHTAAVHALASMANNGLDLYYCLPILSNYLGHETLRSTEKYVRLTAEMYPSIIEKSNKIYPFLFPELYKLD